jgi:hypothetical protein
MLDLDKKENKISRFEQICHALKEAIAEAKEDGAENEGGFSCDVIFDENGEVECAKVCFYEYFNYCIMYAKDSANDIVDVLYGTRKKTDYGNNFDVEVCHIASIVLDFYDAGEWRSGVFY